MERLQETMVVIPAKKKGVPVKSPFNQFYGGWANHFDWILCHIFGEKTRVFDVLLKQFSRGCL